MRYACALKQFAVLSQLGADCDRPYLGVLVHQSSAVCELGWRIESHLRHSVRVEDGANCMQQQLKRSVALSFLWAIQD